MTCQILIFSEGAVLYLWPETKLELSEMTKRVSSGFDQFEMDCLSYGSRESEKMDAASDLQCNWSP